MTAAMQFEQAGRLPVPEDNVAIASRRLEAGTPIAFEGQTFALSHTVMEGHRFAVRPIAKGEPVLSWALPFGTALVDIAPGGYLCNQRAIERLALRHLDFALPERPNFEDRLVRYELDPAQFRPGTQVPMLDHPGTFMGFDRGAGRGVGTRNHVVVLGTSSLTANYARLLAERMQAAGGGFPNVDGVVAVTHSEGGADEAPNNLAFVLRTLAGFLAHPNVGAVLAVDQGSEAVNNRVLQDFMAAEGYEADAATRSFLTLEGDLEPMLERGEEVVRELLPVANRAERSEQPMRHLKLALQCGGSDAFSGISGNPLAGWIAKEVIRNGGAANLAETDELIGAETYILENVKDLATAQAFLEKIDIFRERAAWHGQSLEGNPSGGNLYRGLYNITLKSIGAARKRDPEVRVDGVLDYGQPMTEPGYYFMDSPGNDLESIAGQVATGANMILFITGNGSITNFPFVPTIKIMTTSGRFGLLAHDMDVNAGRYQDGEPLEALGREAFDDTVGVASGALSVGEKAGHSQVSIWRDWRQTAAGSVEQFRDATVPDGRPLALNPDPPGAVGAPSLDAAGGAGGERIGLIVPASLCSGQIARMIADKLNAGAAPDGIGRFVALVHTEGCGCGGGGGDAERLMLRTLAGYLGHPSVARALVLEHGCEKTVNDYIRNFLETEGYGTEGLGWASVQLDGGIEPVVEKVMGWFREHPPAPAEGAAPLRVGLAASGPPAEADSLALAALARAVVAAGGTVVIPQNAPLLTARPFAENLFAEPPPRPSLAYGQVARTPGLHVMETPTSHPVETITGLGATGVEVMLALVNKAPLPAHPFVPLIQVSADPATCRRWPGDLDACLEGAGAGAMAKKMARLLGDTVSRAYLPRLTGQGAMDFQITRGWLGISL